MKLFKAVIPVLLICFSLSAIAQQKTETFKVFGVCGMCKNRIEKALKTDGISKADWDTETKQLTVSYNAALTNVDDIHKRITAVGHDTEKLKADDQVYAKLPGCCKYEREKSSANKSGSRK